MGKLRANINNPKKPQDNEDEWLVTYADAVTLLLAFFVTLTSISKIDIPQWDEITTGIKSELGKRDVIAPTALLESKITQVISDLAITTDVAVSKDSEGVKVTIAAGRVFPDGSANLRASAGEASGVTFSAADLLDEIGLEATGPGFENYLVEVQSHVERGASTGNFQTGWELTAQRAAAIVRALERSIPRDKLSAKAFADANPPPPAPILDSDGEPTGNFEAPESNDRIVIRVFPDPNRDQVIDKPGAVRS